MKYFDYLTSGQKKNIFYIEPSSFCKNTDIELLSYAIGAILYMPALRENIVNDILNKKHKGLMSMVICLEDAIGDNEVQKAELCLTNTLSELHSLLENGSITIDDIPLIFARVRNPEHIGTIAQKAGKTLSVLTGFVFPKFSPYNAQKYFDELVNINYKMDKPLYAMPILETPDIMFEEKRLESLCYLRNIIDEYKRFVLNVRIGATDFCSLFGIRRSYDITIYDIAVMRDCISSIVNFFSRQEKEYVVSGPVWEYFSVSERVLKSHLRVSPFKETYGNKGIQFRSKILDQYIDGLIHEVILDKTNGLVGKTIIHPSHIIPVQSLYVVSHEEYVDACNILSNCNGETGVLKSQYSNKMNEIKPHLSWAKKIITRSKIYGVFNEHQTFTNLLSPEECL